jgi:hypothetical protein
MKEHPIIFSAPMVRAILEGRKTQTRRVVNDQRCVECADDDPKFLIYVHSRKCEGYCDYACRHPCPYGEIGDRLWVKETFFAFGRWETRFSEKKGRDEWHFVDMTLDAGKRYQYNLPEGYRPTQNRGGVIPDWWKRPGIFMPRVASRIALKVTNFRIELLQDITEEDAQAEGVPMEETPGYYGSLPGFEALWDKLNAKRGHSWESNPWVWAISFRRVEG